MTKLSASLPGGDANGLVSIARDLIDEPHTVHVVVALVDCKKVTTDNDSGESVPTARIRRIEVISEREQKRAAEKMMRRGLEHRTGKTVLPFDLEEDLRAAFGNVDPHTGEILGDN